MVPAFVAAFAFSAMAVDEEGWFLGHEEGAITQGESEEMGAASSAPELGMEEMEPAVPAPQQDEEFTPSASAPQEGIEEMDLAGPRSEESTELEGAPYRLSPPSSQPY